MSSTLGPEAPDFSKGASGPANVYDSSPSGLGISIPYLASGATATSTATLSTVMLTGIIPASGNTATAGTGFTYTHTNGTGTYVFTFTTPFAVTPTIIVTPALAYWVGISAQSISGFTLVTNNQAGAAGDTGFNFIVFATT